MALTTLHTTLVFEREIRLGPAAEAILPAFAKVRFVIDHHRSVRGRAPLGARNRVRECGKDLLNRRRDPNIHGTTRYLEIIANRRVVSSETVVMDGKRLCASLTTLELTPSGEKTKLKSTTQLASFIGEDMVKGHETGNNASLDNLVQYFSN
jgi:hypothetical protein